MRIGNVGSIVVFAFLACRVWRIADDDADVEGFLLFAAGAVFNEQGVDQVFLFRELEGRRSGRRLQRAGNRLRSGCGRSFRC